MAAQTCLQTQHATLSGTTADSVAWSGGGANLAVTNHDASVLLYFALTGTAVSAADETYVVRPGQTKVVSPAPVAKTISVVGNGNAYSVEVY